MPPRIPEPFSIGQLADLYFWPHVDQSGGVDACWPWKLSCSSTGYGQLNRRCFGGARTAHGLAYELVHGAVPDGKLIDHTCHNDDVSCPGGKGCWHRACCNPRHLVAKSNQDNLDAANEARKRGKFVEACPADHSYDEVNTGWVWRQRRNKPGFWERYCRTCARIRTWKRKHPGERHPEE